MVFFFFDRVVNPIYFNSLYTPRTITLHSPIFKFTSDRKFILAFIYSLQMISYVLAHIIGHLFTLNPSQQVNGNLYIHKL
jgi:hypothetical protein